MNQPSKITRNSARKNAAKKKAQHAKNVAARAALYAEFSHIGWMSGGDSRVSRWHSTIEALRGGNI
jgi:hypothetical protein